MLEVQVPGKEKSQSKVLSVLKRGKFKKFLIILLIVLILGTLYGFFHYYRKYQELKADPDLEAQQEVESLQEAISEFMDLPEDETPSVATILDKDKLKDQAFFENAENGDKLLVYTRAMKAILYRPSSNRVIEVAPIYIDPESLEQEDEVSQVSNGPNSLIYSEYINNLT